MGECEHAGEWSCEICAETFDVETKMDPALHAKICQGSDSCAGQSSRPNGYRRRRRELDEFLPNATDYPSREVRLIVLIG